MPSAPLSVATRDASAQAVSVRTADRYGWLVARGTPARKMLKLSLTTTTARLQTRAPWVVASSR